MVLDNIDHLQPHQPTFSLSFYDVLLPFSSTCKQAQSAAAATGITVAIVTGIAVAIAVGLAGTITTIATVILPLPLTGLEKKKKKKRLEKGETSSLPSSMNCLIFAHHALSFLPELHFFCTTPT